MFWTQREREGDWGRCEWLLLHVVFFLSGQAASRIPEFPSFFNTYTYLRFPGKERNKEGNKCVTFCVFFLTCHKNAGIFPRSVQCDWCLGVFSPPTQDKPSGWKTYQSITLSLFLSLSQSLVLWLRSVTTSLSSLLALTHSHYFSQWCCWTDEDQHKERLSHTTASSITLFLSLSVSMTLCPLTFSQLSVVLPISLFFFVGLSFSMCCGTLSIFGLCHPFSH